MCCHTSFVARFDAVLNVFALHMVHMPPSLPPRFDTATATAVAAKMENNIKRAIARLY